jgi:hypothetical protein
LGGAGVSDQGASPRGVEPAHDQLRGAGSSIARGCLGPQHRAGHPRKTNGRFKLVGESYGFAPYGIAVPKHNGMTTPILAALKALMADGTYAQILTKWRIQSGAISTPKINGAIS